MMAAKENSKNKMRERPLSPHLTIYKPQITSTLSIMHRITGFFMLIGCCVLTWWLGSIAAGELAYDKFNYVISSSIAGKILLMGWSFAFFYHLANGIRHLFWDIGIGFKLETVTASGIAVLLFSLIMSITVTVIIFTT